MDEQLAGREGIVRSEPVRDRPTGQALLAGREAATLATRCVTGERVRLLVAAGLGERVATALLAPLAALALYPAVAMMPLALWLVATMSIGAVRLSLERAYARTPADIRDSSHPRWARRFTACALASGLAWSALATLLPSAADPRIVPLLAVHAACVVLVSGRLASWLPAAVGFVAPSTLAFAAVVSLRADAALAGLACLPIAVGVVSLLGAQRNASALLDSIRRRVRHEEENVRLAADRDRAELAERAQRQLLAAACHDLRQPVYAMNLLGGVLRSRLGDEAADGTVGKLRQSIAALSALLDGVLDTSATEAGAAEIGSRSTTLEAVLRRVERVHDIQAREKHLSLAFDAPADLRIHVDPTMLERVLTNLVGNAIKFTERGGVTVSARAVGARVSLSVRDTGRGIPPAECERIFSAYHQVRPEDRGCRDGRGLGLAIVRQLCARMNVPIALHSLPGEGSEFRLSLPGEPGGDGGRSARSDGAEGSRAKGERARRRSNAASRAACPRKTLDDAGAARARGGVSSVPGTTASRTSSTGRRSSSSASPRSCPIRG